MVENIGVRQLADDLLVLPKILPINKNKLVRLFLGGEYRSRTDDLLLAKQAL